MDPLTISEQTIDALAGEPVMTARRIWASIGTQTGARQYAQKLGISGSQAVRAFKRRQERAKAAVAHIDPLAVRAPMSRRWLEKTLCAAYQRCGYRSATHGHALEIRTGMPGVESATSAVRPSAVGLPNAYVHSVAQSEHTLTVAEDWCGAVRARGAARVEGALVLSLAREPERDGQSYRAVWARQGRGTHLVAVHGWLRTDENGEWKRALWCGKKEP